MVIIFLFPIFEINIYENRTSSELWRTYEIWKLSNVKINIKFYNCRFDFGTHIGIDIESSPTLSTVIISSSVSREL